MLRLILTVAMGFVLLQLISESTVIDVTEPIVTEPKAEEAVLCEDIEGGRADACVSETNREESDLAPFPKATVTATMRSTETEIQAVSPKEEAPAPDSNIEQVPTGSTGRGVRVDTNYRDASRVLSALLSNGATIVLADEQYRARSQVIGAGNLGQIDGHVPGVPRLATQPVAEFYGREFPADIKYGLVIWPTSLWQQLMEAAPSSSSYLTVELEANGSQLSALVQPMPNDAHSSFRIDFH